ncbi:MAG TPA: hypothetical protein VFU02_21430 [Polyangiaceae bacterium]|nr:hypothetical protein [Polyangiaceae bacterium]
MSSETLVIIGLCVVALATAIVLTLILSTRDNKRRRMQLRQRFGPEYERAIEEYGSETLAEKALLTRAKRVQKLHLRELARETRARHASAWENVQRLFVDDPVGAVNEADALIKTVMRDIGYPIEDFDQRVADLSVDHPSVVQHYRAARTLAVANREGRANTEELRQAFVHYRALFADLLGEVPAQPHYQEARA